MSIILLLGRLFYQEIQKDKGNPESGKRLYHLLVHTFITKLYRQLRASYGQSETYDKLMLITGYQTLKAL